MTLRAGGAWALGIFVALGVAAAVLTELNPDHTSTVVATSASESPLVLAGQAGDFAVGVAITPHDAVSARVQATVIGQEGPRSGLVVRFVALGRTWRARSCGVGCYAALAPLTRGRPQLAVAVGSPPRIARFAAPANWPAPDATALLYRVDAAWRRLRSLTAVIRIASDPRHEVTTLWRYGRPDRVSYAILPRGAQAVVIGNRRWDRESPRGRWQESTQDPVEQPTPPWFSGAIADAHLLGSEIIAGRRVLRISFVEPSAPAWFTLLVNAETYRTASLSMIAQAHFMSQDNADFDAAAAIEPPS
jgi:hypothetical protein